MHNSTIKHSHLVIGMGEVGTAIQRIFEADWIDKDKMQAEQKQYNFLHVCIPFSDDFIDIVNYYKKEFHSDWIIIHSTVPVGTSRKLSALHSPIRGLHPYLYEGILTFPKFIGGENSGPVAQEFRRAGLKVVLLDVPEATELGKLLDTEYYRACIEFTQKAKKLCDNHGVPFHEAYTLFNQTYNEGYAKLGYPEYIRPVLQPISGPIGGHCVIPNSKLL